MNRVTPFLSTVLLGLGVLVSACNGSDKAALPPSEAPVVVQGTGAPNDPCADYVNQGLACEYLAFPEMEIRAGGHEVAGVAIR